MSNSWMFSDRIGLFMVYAPNFCMPEYVVQRVIFHSIICRLADCRLGQNPNFCLSFLLILKNGRERKCLVVKRSKYSKATHKILLLSQLHGKVLTRVFGGSHYNWPARRYMWGRAAKCSACTMQARRRAAPPFQNNPHSSGWAPHCISLAALYIWIIGKIMKLQPHSTAFELNHLLRYWVQVNRLSVEFYHQDVALPVCQNNPLVILH